MRNLIFYITFLILLGVNSSIFGQWKAPDPQSPEAASLSKALNYPVSHNTGVPNISVPLFSVQVGQINLPFVLSYHAGGFKANEVEGLAGLGWSLSPSLQITRSVRGRDDLINGGFGLDIKGYAYNEFCIGPNGDAILNNGDSAYDIYMNTYNSWKRNQDHEPDQFNYSLLGKSGSFFFQKDSNGTHIVPSPYNGVKIEMVSSGFKITDTDGTVYHFDGDTERTGGDPWMNPTEWNNYAPITAWKCRQVVSPNKTDVINFQYKDKASQYAYSFSRNVEVYQTPCNDSFNFFGKKRHFYAGNINPSYTKYEDVLQNHMTNGVYGREPNPRYVINSDAMDSGVYTPYASDRFTKHTRFFTYNKAKGGVSITEIRGKTLDRISFSGGEVKFEYLPNSDQLKSLKLTSGVTTKRADFMQTLEGVLPPSPDGNIESYKENYSWYLDGLTLDNEATYLFHYNNKKSFGNYFTGSDAWGFPNENTGDGFSSTLQLPSIQQELEIYDYKCDAPSAPYFMSLGLGSVFAADPYTIKRGVLEWITYPTGGKTFFEFEGNLGNQAAANQNEIGPTRVGGLRIKKIKNFDYTGKLASSKWYVYELGLARGTNGDFSFGYRPGTLEHAAPDIYKYRQTIKHFVPTSSNNEIPLKKHEFGVSYGTAYTETKTTWLPDPRYGLNYANGSPIYYKEVTEHYSDNTDNITQEPSIVGLGKTIYKYGLASEFGHGYGQEWERSNRTGIHLSWQMGKLKSVTDMKVNHAGFSQYDTIRKKTYKYTKNILANKKIYYGQTFATSIPAGLPNDLEKRGYEILYNYRGLDIGNVLIEKETETLYNDNGKITTTTEYNYDTHGQLESTTVLKSNGEEMRTSITRANENSLDPMQMDLVANNMLSYPIREITYNNNLVIGGKENHYYTDGTGHLKEIHKLELNNSSYTWNPDDFQKKISLAYTSGRVTLSTPEDGIPTSYLWGYNGFYPVVKGTNISDDDLDTAVKDVIAELQNEWSYIIDLESLLIELEITLKNTDAWEQFNTKLNQHPLVKDKAHITTYTYAPLVGITSMTDPRGYTIYYSYDSFNRLKEVRDEDNNLVTDYDYHYRDNE